MRKSTLFISVVLTTFMLAVLFGVASAYQSIVASKTAPVADVQSQPTEVVDMVSAPVVAPVVTTQVTPEDAAAIASKVIARTDLYSVEVTQFEGVDAYLVTFSSGDLVYLSLDGQVLSISQLPVTVITQRKGGGGDDDGGGGGDAPVPVTNTGDGEDHDEHEGGDD